MNSIRLDSCRRILTRSILTLLTSAASLAFLRQAHAQESFSLNATGSGPSTTNYNWNDPAIWIPAGAYPGLDGTDDIATVNFFESPDITGDSTINVDLQGGTFNIGVLNISEGAGNADGNFANGTLNLSAINYLAGGGREIDFESSTSNPLGEVVINGVDGNLVITSAGNNFDFLGAVNAANSLRFSATATQFMRLSRRTTGSAGALTLDSTGTFIVQLFNSNDPGLRRFTVPSLTVTSTGKLEVDRDLGSLDFGIDVTGLTTLSTPRFRFQANDADGTLNLNGTVLLNNGGAGIAFVTENQRAIVSINSNLQDAGGNEVVTFGLHGPLNGSASNFGRAIINNAATNRTAETLITGGLVILNVDSKAGSGLGSGRIQVRGHGALQIATPQTALNIDVAEFGAIAGDFTGAVLGGNVTIASQNVVFVDGLSGVAIPTTAETGGAVHFRGLTVNTGSFTVGDDGNAETTTDIFRGVAFGGYMATGDFQGDLNAEAGQPLNILLSASKNFRPSSGTAGSGNIPSFNPGDVGGTVNLIGPANLRIQANGANALDGTFQVINRIGIPSGDYRSQNSVVLELDDANAVVAGKTINVTDGRVHFLDVNSLAAGAILNINAGAMLHPERNLTTGTVNIGEGGAFRINANGRLTAGATFNFEDGAILILDLDLNTDPFPENVDIVVSEDTFTGKGIVLGNGRRLTTAITESITIASGTTAGINAVPGATGVVFSAGTGRTLGLSANVNLAGVNLQVGDAPGTVPNVVAGGNDNTRATDVQTGIVQVNAGLNVQNIDVQSGVFRLQSGTHTITGGLSIAPTGEAIFNVTPPAFTDVRVDGLFTSLGGNRVYTAPKFHGTGFYFGNITIDGPVQDTDAGTPTAFKTAGVGTVVPTGTMSHTGGTIVGGSSILRITSTTGDAIGTGPLVTQPGAVDGTLRIDPGAGNTANFANVSSVLNNSLIQVATGTGNFGNKFIDSTNLTLQLQPISDLAESFFTPADVGLVTFNASGPVSDLLLTFENPSGTFLTETPGATGTLSGQSLNFTDATLSTHAGGYFGGNDQQGAAWEGTITIGGAIPAGDVSFGTRSDDGSALYVDANQDGVFQASERIVSNFGLHGELSRTGTVSLAAGTYNFAVGFYEATGGGRIEARVGSGSNLPYDAQFVINPGGPLSPVSKIQVDNGGQLIAGGFKTHTMTLNGSGTVTLGAAASPIASSAVQLIAANSMLDLGANHTVDIGTLSVGNGNTLTVNGPGRLNLNEAAGAGTGSVSVFGATIGGTGAIGGSLTGNAAILAPGQSPGTLSIAGNLTLDAASTYLLELGGSTPGDGPGFYDQTLVSGNSSFDQVTLDITSFALYAATNATFYILATDGLASGNFRDPLGLPLAEGALFVSSDGLVTGNITYAADWTGSQAGSTLAGGNDVALFNVTVIPEPGSALLLALSTGLLGARRRRFPLPAPSKAERLG